MIDQYELNQYYHQIQNEIMDTSDGKHRILAAIKCDVEEYLFANPKATMNDILQVFGTPDMYAKEYLGLLSNSEVYGKLRSKRSHARVFLIFAVSIILLIAVLFASIIHQNNHDVIKYYSEDIVDGTTQSID